MMTPPTVGLRTLALVTLFAFPNSQANEKVTQAAVHYRVAREAMNEAKQTSNPVELAILGWKIGDELEETVRLDPNELDARIDLVRYYTVAPRIVGGSAKKARAQARELTRRDPALGAFANGYIDYRDKAYGPARQKLRDAGRLAKDAKTKVLALTWLGWLSQETQQYDDAYRAWEEVLATDPLHVEALYEIGRTSVFAHRDVARGEEALRQYLSSKRTSDMPSEEEARKLLEKLQSYETLR
jgi:tetratricopeptide (TPR) repeat protein